MQVYNNAHYLLLLNNSFLDLGHLFTLFDVADVNNPGSH
jgi:hypothetical protein